MIRRITTIGSTEATQIARLGSMFYARLGTSGSFHPSTFLDFWTKLLDAGIAAMWVSDKNGIINGAIGGTVSLSMFDGNVFVEENFWFVKNSGSDGPRLFKTFVEWAEEIGAKRVVVGSLESSPEAIGHFYSRCGFKKFQTQYIKEL